MKNQLPVLARTIAGFTKAMINPDPAFAVVFSQVNNPLGGGPLTLLGDEGALELANVLKSELIVQPPPVVTLNLNGNQIGPAGIKQLAQALISPYCPPQINLAIAGNPIGLQGTTALVEAITDKRCASACSLFLNVPDMGEGGLQKLCQGLASGKCISGFTLMLLLSENNELAQNELIELSRALESGLCPQNLTLRLLSSNENAVALANVLTSGKCPDDLTLDLTEYGTTAEDRKNGKIDLNTSIAFASALTSRLCPRRLTLILNEIANIDPILKALKDCPSDFTLDLAKSRQAFNTKQEAIIAEALLKHPSLTINLHPEIAISTEMKLILEGCQLRNKLIKQFSTYPDIQDFIKNISAEYAIYISSPSVENPLSPLSLKSLASLAMIKKNMHVDIGLLPAELQEYIKQLNQLSIDLAKAAGVSTYQASFFNSKAAREAKLSNKDKLTQVISMLDQQEENLSQASINKSYDQKTIKAFKKTAAKIRHFIEPAIASSSRVPSVISDKKFTAIAKKIDSLLENELDKIEKKIKYDPDISLEEALKEANIDPTISNFYLDLMEEISGKETTTPGSKPKG